MGLLQRRVPAGRDYIYNYDPDERHNNKHYHDFEGNDYDGAKHNRWDFSGGYYVD